MMMMMMFRKIPCCFFYRIFILLLLIRGMIDSFHIPSSLSTRTKTSLKNSHQQQQQQQQQNHDKKKRSSYFILLDRDGVINDDVGSPGVISKSQFVLLPGVASSIGTFKRLGHTVVLITNQSCGT